MNKIISNKAFKVFLAILLLAGCVRLGVFLYNVNRDLDDLYYKVQALQKENASLRSSLSSLSYTQDKNMEAIVNKFRSVDKGITGSFGYTQSIDDRLNR